MTRTLNCLLTWCAMLWKLVLTGLGFRALFAIFRVVYMLKAEIILAICVKLLIICCLATECVLKIYERAKLVAMLLIIIRRRLIIVIIIRAIAVTITLLRMRALTKKRYLALLDCALLSKKIIKSFLTFLNVARLFASYTYMATLLLLIVLLKMAANIVGLVQGCLTMLKNWLWKMGLAGL